jgi:hypothetical protein
VSNIFDVETTYEIKVSPLVKQINELCRENGIPFVMSFAVVGQGGNNEFILRTSSDLIKKGQYPAEFVRFIDSIMGGPETAVSQEASS